jgi:DNA-binding ferritin-like protein
VDFYPPGKNGLQSPHWSVEPQNRQRLDHYVGSYYNPGPDDDPEGWDQDGWDEEYAGPLHDEVQSKLDARFGTGVFQVDIGEKGHISVDPTSAGMKALGMGKTGMWKKGYTEGTPGAVNAARTVFSNLLALLRAVQWSHLASHWQSAGEASYGDHLLFERMYGKVVGETDALAEKLVGTFGNLAVDAKEQAKLMAFTLHQMGEHGDPFERALHIEQTLQVSIKNCVTATENLGQLSLGMDDLLRTMANDHETHIYLIQQRQGGARVASALGRKDPTTRLSVRHILRQVQAAAEAGHLLKPTSVVNLRMRL